MGRTRFLFLFCVLAVSAPSPSYAASTPWRVVTMTPALAELASAVGLPESNIVGVSEYTDFPLELKKKPSVGPYSKPSLEKIVGLKPDLVLASEDATPHELIRRLRKLKIPVMVLKTDSLTSVEEAYGLLAKAFGQEVQGSLALKALRQKTEALKTRGATRKKAKNLTVMIQVGEDPLVVSGGVNFLNEGLELLGVLNSYSDVKKAYPRVSLEDVLKRNPDVILLVALGDDTRAFEKAKKRWLTFSALTAVREKRIFIIQSDALVRPGPRFPDGVAEIESVLFGKTGNSK